MIKRIVGAPLIKLPISTQNSFFILPIKILNMLFKIRFKKVLLVTIVQFIIIIVLAQPGVPFTKWANDGNAYYQVEGGEIIKIDLPSQK